MANYTRKDLDDLVINFPITYDTYSPGDGVTRYRFFAGTHQGNDYYAGGGVFTALGISEAMTFALGWTAGYDSGFYCTDK